MLNYLNSLWGSFFCHPITIYMRGQGKHNFWYFIYLFIFILQLSVEVLILWACVHFQAFLFSLKVINNPCKLLGALILLWGQECTGVTYAIFPQDIFLSTNQNSTSTFIFKRNPPRSAASFGLGCCNNRHETNQRPKPAVPCCLLWMQLWRWKEAAGEHGLVYHPFTISWPQTKHISACSFLNFYNCFQGNKYII